MKARAQLYEIQIEEPFEPHWREWFPGLEISACPDTPAQTTLRGRLADQTALFGVLARIRDLNLTLVSLRRIEPVP